MDTPAKLDFTAQVVFHDQGEIIRTSWTIRAYTAHAAAAAIKADLRDAGKSHIKVRTPMPCKFRIST